MLTGPQFGKHLRTVARGRGVSNSTLAGVAGVSPQAVNGWFRTGRISKDSLAAIAPMLHASLDELFAIAPEHLAHVAPAGAILRPRRTIGAHRPGATIASLRHEGQPTTAELARLLRISEPEAAQLVAGEVMPTPEQKRLLGAIFNIDPDSIADETAVTALSIPGAAGKQSLVLDGYEYQLIQQYRNLPEDAQHVLRSHAVRLEEAFGPSSSRAPFGGK